MIDDLRARIATPTTIAALLARLSDDDSDVVESVVDAVTELTKYGKFLVLCSSCWHLIIKQAILKRSF